MSKNPSLPIALCAEDIPHAVLGYASTKTQAKKLILKALGAIEGELQIEKIGADNLLNTSGAPFWQYTTRQVVETKPLTISDAIALLLLEEQFDLLDLKTAYRQKCKETHPDAGGSHAAFLQIDRAYDLLKSALLMQPDKAQHWDAYMQQHAAEWEQNFRADWKAVCDRGLRAPDYEHQGAFRYGLHYSTCIERFARKCTYPLDSWFLHVVYPESRLLGNADAPSIAEIRNAYRSHLLAISPNKLMAEIWARKYFQLEFGADVPWVFYLMPAKEEVTA